MTTKAQKAAEKAAQAAAEQDKPTVREPMADAPAAPALADINTQAETMDGAEAAGSETMDTAEADTDVSESAVSAAGHAREVDKDGVELIRMRRDAPLHEGAPTEADVHPDEVENWHAAGWVIDA